MATNPNWRLCANSGCCTRNNSGTQRDVWLIRA